jgi:hypothetical protein
VSVHEYLPGKEPTDYDLDLSERDGYVTRFWRCRLCGQERNHRSEFRESCTVETPSSPITDGGYSVEEPRTRRALTENMDIRFGEQGPVYEVHSESGSVYQTDIQNETCSCPDEQRRNLFCKHLRRVDLEIRAGILPGPDGRFQHRYD